MKLSYYKISIFSLFIIIFLPITLAITFTGTDGSDVYSSDDSAIGSIAQRDANDTATNTESIIFSWGGPVGNGSSAADLSSSGLGISASSDTYIITFGPDLTEDVAVSTPTSPPAETESSSSIPSSGGGGGSSSRETYGLVVGDKLTVLINNQPYKIAIKTVKEDNVELTIEEISETFELKLDETKEFDLDKDNIPDMSITLDAVSDLLRVTITVEDLTKQKEQETINKDQDIINAAEVLEAVKPITGAAIGMMSEQAAEVKTSLKTALTTIIGLNVLLGVILNGLFTAKHIKMQRAYKAFHTKNKQDIINLELKKVEAYVAKALHNGYSKDQIKHNLLIAGWQEQEIDEILVEAMLNQDDRLIKILSRNN
ncbi:hypothetical protein COV16_06055 [Candidatus Woesearchaeota archaeon CG10_big_fil_rev_8_21_14_0_10_34_8]|nr:MAG: hypothetical protein COV16_06055 [Candidatus Woesearchaeota archaeon CG10_big_fil_rev_8_21_14_0_10_34_8]